MIIKEINDTESIAKHKRFIYEKRKIKEISYRKMIIKEINETESIANHKRFIYEEHKIKEISYRKDYCNHQMPRRYYMCTYIFFDFRRAFDKFETTM